MTAQTLLFWLFIGIPILGFLVCIPLGVFGAIREAWGTKAALRAENARVRETAAEREAELQAELRSYRKAERKRSHDEAVERNHGKVKTQHYNPTTRSWEDA